MKDGKANACKPCNRLFMKPKTKEQAGRHAKKYYWLHRDRCRDRCKEYSKKNRVALSNKKMAHIHGKGRDVYKKWYENTKERRNELRRLRRKNMPPKQKVEKALRDRFTKVIRRAKKGEELCSWRDLIGCTILQFKEYIENQFVDGMSWENHGNGDNKWNIDHIQPLCTFNLMDLEQQKIAFHYSNTRPLWFIDNMKRRKRS